MIVFAACDTTEKKPTENKMQPTGDVIKDSGLIVYNPFNVAVDQQKSHPSYTILSYVDVTCSVCIFEIDKWKAFYDSSAKKDFDVKLVFHAHDKFEYIKYLCENKSIKPFPFPFYLDTAQRYAKLNPVLKKDASDKTVVVDKSGQVVLQGNPLHADSTRVKYKNLLM